MMVQPMMKRIRQQKRGKTHIIEIGALLGVFFLYGRVIAGVIV